MNPRITRHRLAPDPTTGWRTWELRLRGRAVGQLLEHRAWRGWRYGPPEWIAVHLPPGRETALWSSEPRKTQAAAIGELHSRVTATAPCAHQ
jgi:hypothetical protein